VSPLNPLSLSPWCAPFCQQRAETISPIAPPSISRRACCTCRQRKLYRVGPNCETWPNTFTAIPYKSLKVGPQFGPTLYNFRCPRRTLRCSPPGAGAATGVAARRAARRTSGQYCEFSAIMKTTPA
jgi:hypothetical protein